MLRWNRSSWQPWMVSVCVCVCVKWWERKGRGCKCLSSMITLPSPLSRLFTLYANMQHGCGRQILSAEWRYGAFELRSETEEAHTGKPRRHWLFTEALRTIDSGGVGTRKKKILFAIFKKKWKIIFKKAESEKKSGIPPKSGRLTSLKQACWTGSVQHINRHVNWVNQKKKGNYTLVPTSEGTTFPPPPLPPSCSIKRASVCTKINKKWDRKERGWRRVSFRSCYF